MTEALELKLKNLPDSPGCYLMKRRGEILYVGKAVNLKNRVRSYFHTREHTPKVAAMVSQVEDFDIVLCDTNLEALILECNLIKLHKPYYNILLKDDKQYPYIRVNMAEPFPRVTLARRVDPADKGARWFGPYIGASAVRDVLETLRKTFPIRACEKALPLKNPGRPCVNFEIGRCLAPCANKCSQEEYARVMDGVLRFLSGRFDETTARLKDEMALAAREMRYEKAAQLRDSIRDIEGLMERQLASRASGGDQDVLFTASDGLDAMANILLIRGGRIVDSQSFALAREGAEPPEDTLTGFLLQYYEDRKPAREVVCGAVTDPESIEKWLREKRGGAVDLTIPQRGEKRALLLLCEKNARDALQKRNARAQVKRERTIGACEELAKAIGMTTVPSRIEGFDISNTQGVLSVASMVVFIDGEPARKEYRHYRIKTVQGANDFASMEEVLGRRFRRAVSDDPGEKWVMPDLVLIDGGPEQLLFARRAMLSAGADVPMFGLAKKLEEIYLPGREDTIYLDRHSPALYLIQRIRDEAHRFAITFHRSLRGKAAVHSALDDIPGVGPARRRALLQYFGSVSAVRAAGEEELMKVKGMSRPAAKAIVEWFENK